MLAHWYRPPPYPHRQEISSQWSLSMTNPDHPGTNEFLISGVQGFKLLSQLAYEPLVQAFPPISERVEFRKAAIRALFASFSSNPLVFR